MCKSVQIVDTKFYSDSVFITESTDGYLPLSMHLLSFFSHTLSTFVLQYLCYFIEVCVCVCVGNEGTHFIVILFYYRNKKTNVLQ